MQSRKFCWARTVIRMRTSRWQLSRWFRKLEKLLALPTLNRYRRKLHLQPQSETQSHNGNSFCVAPDWWYTSVTVCTAGCSHASLELLKNYLTSNMKEHTFSNLAPIHIHHDRNQSRDVIDRFASKIKDSILFNFVHSFFHINRFFQSFSTEPLRKFLYPPLHNLLSAAPLFWMLISLKGISIYWFSLIFDFVNKKKRFLMFLLRIQDLKNVVVLVKPLLYQLLLFDSVWHTNFLLFLLKKILLIQKPLTLKLFNS